MGKPATVVVFIFALTLALPLGGPAAAQEQHGATVIPSSKNDVSPRLASIPPQTEGARKDRRERPLRGFPHATAGSPDAAVQGSGPTAAPPHAASLPGVRPGLVGPARPLTG